MKFSENWLRSLVDLKASREELAHRLTMAGLEVEGIEAYDAPLAGVVVGEIVAAEKHPQADKLQVCRVRAGAEELQIVCGAPNARVGLKAPLATIGATLPNGTAIKAAKLRGVESYGMLCSATELGLGSDTSGLLELPAELVAGTPLATALALPDSSFELKLTPNRPDCLGLEGLASEVATLFDVPRRSPDTTPVAAAGNDTRGVSLAAPERCPRFCGRVIRGIDPNARTPLWMAERLRRSGLRPISPVVDCTNYVMLELGQPLHAFDLAKLVGDIVVRPAREGETLKLLDGRDVVLDQQFLVVADEREAVALGGIMGGEATKVTDATTDVFLEAAHWVPAAIIGRARRLGMHTDASHRFERGVDPELPRRAIERMTRLLLEIVGGRPGPLIEAVEPAHLPQRKPVHVRRARVKRVLGMDVPDARIAAILRGLDMQVDATADGWTVIAPTRRFDIEIEEDLIEEIARVHGYDRVPVHSPSGEIAPFVESETRVPLADARRVLASRGYADCVELAFVPQALLDTWQLGDGALALANPLSAELGVMRTSLLPGLVQALGRNLARQQQRVRLSEAGNAFGRGIGAHDQALRIAAVATGPADAEQWGVAARDVDYYDLKGELEQLASLAGTADALAFEPASVPFLHPGRSGRVSLRGVAIGWLGHLHPRLLKSLGLERDVVVFEVDLEPLLARAVPRAGEVSRFPMVRRDIAVVAPQALPFATVAATVRRAVGPLLADLVLFDEFTGGNLSPGSRSLAIGLILQDHYRTLTDLDADRSVASALDALAREHDVKLRG
ncbi:MAG TPA: phenylalanine--tRNA ligase subunit beta [Xanthomonadales bacterium]|nr:phenylalanine--tRNA ligase subunit beta [Xanthomonadales bacterium]